MTHSAPPAPGRRSVRARRQRLDVTLVLAVLLPVLGAGALLLVSQDPPADPVEPPTAVELTRATLVCPTAIADEDDVALTSAAEDTDGRVQVGLGDALQPADVSSGEVTAASGQPDALAVVGEDDVAAGLVASRFGSGALAAAACPAPAPVAWFTGVGAGAGHTSVLELVNPDSGTAIVDVTVFGRSGVVDADRLAGVAVPGGTSVRLDLGALVPRRDELAIRVVTARGRVGSLVLDRYDEVGRAEATDDWLPAQAEPATSNLLMGLAPGQGRRALVLVNGSDDEVRADVKIVSRRSTFAPEGLSEIQVAPHSVQKVALSSVLGQAIGDGAIGLLLDSTGPVTATVRSYVGGDLSHAVPSDVVDTSATVLVPDGGKDVAKTLQLAGATNQGVVTVSARSASGKQLRRVRVEISPELGVTVKLPAKTALVTIVPERTSVSGSVLVSGRDGAAVVPLRVATSSGLVPAVRPGLP
jgi:hypothetical protein